MSLRYVDQPLVDMDEPEPPRQPRALRPRYLDAEADRPPERRPFAFPHVPPSRAAIVYQPSSFVGMAGPSPVRQSPPFTWSYDDVTDVTADLAAAVRALSPQLRDAFTRARAAVQQVADSLTDAGVLPDPGPTDPKARALWLRQHRNTGPDRDITRQRRPRHHQGRNR